MKRRFVLVVWCLILLSSTMIFLSGCLAAPVAPSQDLMAEIKADVAYAGVELSGDNAAAVTDFAVRLFQHSAEDGKNTLISPLSVLTALSMTANGAKGNTLAQMEDVFGIQVAELNPYLHAYFKALPAGEKYKLSPANSIWFRDDERFTVSQDFLQANANWYNAGIYKAPFDDTTLKDINNWVSENTDGMIKDILDEIPYDAVMYLINALAFEAEWQKIYNKGRVREGVFTKEDGTRQNVELMYSEEYEFLKDEKATGFIKYYADRKYAFVALLPDEGVTVSDYVDSLTGERLRELLTDPKPVQVNAAIPKFEIEYSVKMNEILKGMGMVDAFDYEAADLSGIGSSSRGNLFISRVLHKTFIAVDEKGTKAGAATVVEVQNESAPSEFEIVYLDRPFVYMLIDCEALLPFFIGTAMDIGK
ncbi:MAG TPA: serine protease [Clostridiales bacterium]|nr:serine protease [Clostridiales bacterium]